MVTDQQLGGVAESLVIDRATASRFGVTPATIDNTLYDAFGQRQINTLYTQLNQYHVILETDPKFQNDPQKLHDIYIQSTSISTRCRRRSHRIPRARRREPDRARPPSPGNALLTPSSSAAISTPASSTSALSSGEATTTAAAFNVNQTSALSPSSITSSNATVLSSASGNDRRFLQRDHLRERDYRGQRHRARVRRRRRFRRRKQSGAASSTPVPLSAFTHFETQSEALSINHQGQFPAVTDLLQSGHRLLAGAGARRDRQSDRSRRTFRRA